MIVALEGFPIIKLGKPLPSAAASKYEVLLDTFGIKTAQASNRNTTDLAISKVAPV